MVTNLSAGPIQVIDASVEGINLALAEVLERIDSLKGLRGRGETFDRLRIDSPAEQTDAVDLKSLLTQEFRWRVPFVLSTAPTFASIPGVSYVELSSFMRQQVDFSDLTNLEGRMIISGFGTATDAGKGIAVTTTAGEVIAEVTWDGQTDSVRAGVFVSITQNADTQVQLRTKGSTANEDIVVRYAVAEFKGVINVVAS